MIAPRVAPIVRRTAIARALSCTSMMRPEMMLSAATSTISVRMANITLLSTASTSKKLRLSWRQSVSIIGRCCAGSIASPHRVHVVGIGDIDLDDVGLAVVVEEGLRLGERHEDEGVVEGRHADLEDRGDRIGLHPRRDAERRLARRAAR